MNILYLAHRIPYPPNKGDKIRSFHQVQHLAQKHNVYLVCVVDDHNDLQHVEYLRDYCRVVEAVYRSSLSTKLRIGMALVSGYALSVGAFVLPELQKKVDAILQSSEIDRIVVFSSPMAEYVRKVRHIPRLMDFVDVDSEKWKAYASFQGFPLSVLYRIEARRLGCYEEEIAKEFEQSIFVSSKEAQLFQQRVADRPIKVVSNGVDLHFFQPNDLNEVPSPDNPKIIFTAAMDYFPNIDGVQFFCSTIFPHIRKSVPDACFEIVGMNPSREVRKLGRHPNIRVTGTVQDVRPFLAQAAVAVVPLRIARGVQNKVLEAMAMGLPVVGTSNAFQGISARELNGVRIIDDPQKFAQEVVSLLQDPSLRRRCGMKAREFVEQHHKWEHCGQKLETLLQDMN